MSSTQGTATLGIFVKRPVAGMVKTRLAAAIGGDLAASLYRAFVTDLVERFRTFAGRRVLAITPNDAETHSDFERLSSGDYLLWPQPSGSLGNRLLAYFESFGDEPTIVIGSDSPTLPMSLVNEAVELLKRADVVFGPATDGGVYLIGIRRSVRPAAIDVPKLFANVEWSTSQVGEQLRTNARRAGWSMELLPPWFDVDEPDDLKRLAADLGFVSPTSGLPDSPATRKMLDVLWASSPQSRSGLTG